MTACTINATRRPHNAQRSKQRPVTLSEAKYPGSEILRFAQNESAGKSSRGLVLFLANQGKLFAFHHRAIDRYFGDIFAAWHVVHDVQHNTLEQ